MLLAVGIAIGEVKTHDCPFDHERTSFQQWTENYESNIDSVSLFMFLLHFLYAFFLGGGGLFQFSSDRRGSDRIHSRTRYNLLQVIFSREMFP